MVSEHCIRSNLVLRFQFCNVKDKEGKVAEQGQRDEKKMRKIVGCGSYHNDDNANNDCDTW